MQQQGWIGVDFDGTLATYDGWNDGELGEPIPKMIERVKRCIGLGMKFKILTARGCCHEMSADIQDWLERHGLPRLEVTNKKDYLMIELWDDRAHRVNLNTGEFEREILLARIRELENKLKIHNN